MTFPLSMKTVFVIEHSPTFAESCNQPFEFDLVSKTRSPGIIPLDPLSKSLWTCGVEAVIEYCRVVYDIYPTERCICLIASDTQAHVINAWRQAEQNTAHMLTALAQLGSPTLEQLPEECSITNGLEGAVEMLCERTDQQQEAIADGSYGNVNNGRIVCITTLKNSQHLEDIKEFVKDTIQHQNKMAAASEELLPIDHCELVVVNTHAVDETPVVPVNQDPCQLTSHLSCHVTTTKAGRYLASKLSSLVQLHLDLVITTVTGIPMKEEQNASSSANYDVELLHHRAAHTEIRKMEHIVYMQEMKSEAEKGGGSGGGGGGGGGGDAAFKPGGAKVLLKWCQPRSASAEILHCTSVYRISPVDVNSRPSLCLTNFLLNGRQVMLEQPRKSGTKCISHMLASHGGEIFLHCLSTSRSPLEDPPSISEGCGGRVTDYRINDFGEFMKDNRLAPCQELSDSEGEIPIEQATAQLERMTRHWPLVISDTIIFNMLSHLDPLPSLLMKPVLDEDDVVECKKAVYHLVGMETRNEALPVPSVSTRGKGSKREEQYRQMWSELEVFVRAASTTSPSHEQVLECLLACRKPDEASPTKGRKPTEKTNGKTEKPEAEKMDTAPPPTKIDMGQSSEPAVSPLLIHRNPTDPPPVKRQKMNITDTVGKAKGTPQSLLSLWKTRIGGLHSKGRQEFAGRAESEGPIAQLYLDFFNKENENGETVQKERT